MTEDTIHRVACDVHDLAASCENDPMTRFALEGIANRLEAIEAAGGGALPKIEGAEPRRDWLELPRNITLKRFVMADRSVVFMGQYIQQGKQEPNDRPVRTYRIEVKRSVWGNRWRAAIGKRLHRARQMRRERRGMSLHDNLVTFMVATGQILARGDLRCDMQSLIAPPIRIEPSAAKVPRDNKNTTRKDNSK